MRKNPAISIKSMTISKLHELNKKKKIFINEEYQRSKVWGKKQEKNLIQSIIEKSPIGVLIVKKKGPKLEILDGQQRIDAIIKFLNPNGFVTIENKIFKQLSKKQKSDIKNYRIYSLELHDSLTEEETATIFMRLQEGTTLNTAEKVNAFVGMFKQSFTQIFVSNFKFFKHVDNTRFRGRLLAAHFLLLELESNLESSIFPNITFSTLSKINKKYKNAISKASIYELNKCLKFLGNVLGNDLEFYAIRDLIPLYLLTRYLQKHQKDNGKIPSNIKKFTKNFTRELDSFTVYDTSKPQSLSQKQFDILMNYKNIGRKATSKDSISGRFHIMLEQYKKMFPNAKFEEDSSDSLDMILKNEESYTLEFKSSFIWDYDKNSVNKDLKMLIGKAIAGMLNKKGGRVVIGISPKKEILGLKHDFKHIGTTTDWDAWLLSLTSLITSKIGKDVLRFINIEQLKEHQKTVASVSIVRSTYPIFIDINGKDEFYVRGPNSTLRLGPKDLSSYILSEFSPFSSK